MSWLAEAQAKVGDIAGAKKSVDEAIEADRSGDARLAELRALTAIVEAQARKGDVAGAVETALGINDADTRTHNLARIVEVRAEDRDFKGAWETTALIDNVPGQIRALNSIAYASYKKAKDMDQARKAIDQALAAIEGAKLVGDLAWGLRDLAKDQAETGDLAGALKTAKRIEEIEARERALRDTIEAYSEEGDFAVAFEALKGIRRPGNRVHAMRAIAEGQVEAGIEDGAKQRARKAVDAAQSIEDGYRRTVELSGLAETLAIVGDDATSRKALAMAIEAAKGIDTPVAKSRAMGAIAESLAEAGDIGAAFNTAESISIPAVRARAYIHLADSKGVGGKGPRKPHP